MTRKPIKVKAWAVTHWSTQELIRHYPSNAIALFETRLSAKTYRATHSEVGRIIRVTIEESK